MIPYYIGYWISKLGVDWLGEPKRQREIEETRELQRAQTAAAHQHQFDQLRESYALQERLQRQMAKIAADNGDRLEHKRQEFQEHHTERMRGLDAWWPLKSMPMELFNHHVLTRDTPPPLLLLIAPPKRASDGQSLGADVRITEAVRAVMEEHYPTHSERPVRLLGDIWKPGGKREETAMASFRTYLPGLPLLVLDSEIEGRVLYFRVGYQSADPHVPYFYKTFKDMTVDPARPDEVLRSLLIIHQVMACAMADLHYLARSDGEVQPVLPAILAGLMGEEDGTGVTREALRGYTQVYEMYRQNFPWGQDLVLDYAEKLATTNPALAHLQIELSIEMWLEQRGIPPQPQLGEPLDLMVGHLRTAADRHLYARARKLLAAAS